MTFDEQLERLAQLRRQGLRAVTIDGDGIVTSAEFFERSEHELNMEALQAMTEAQQHEMSRLDEEQRAEAIRQHREALDYASSL